MFSHGQHQTPLPGQESVWDYPRPPRAELSNKHIQVTFNSVVIADTHRAVRMLETSHPPVYYIPPEDAQMQYFEITQRRTYCEFKGGASYYTISVNGKTAENAGWFYAKPTAGFEIIANYFALYSGVMDQCTINGEIVQAQPGDFYGGWITSDIVGPFKGGPGTWGW